MWDSTADQKKSGLAEITQWLALCEVRLDKLPHDSTDRLLHLLNDRDRFVLTSHLRGTSLQQIASELGVSPVRANQLCNRAARIIRTAQISTIRELSTESCRVSSALE
jgi:hypothetical protein